MGSIHKERDARLWGALVGQDGESRREAARTIRALEQDEWYAYQLLAVVSNWPGKQRASAGDALALLGDPRFSAPYYLSEMIAVPAGDVVMGSDACPVERPLHTRSIADFALSQYPITQAAYAVFVEAADYRSPRGWVRRRPLPEQTNAPVVCVSARDAEAYCRWLSGETGHRYRLPTEAEWMMAARGLADHRIYPWGNSLSDGQANVWGKQSAGRLCAAGLFPDGRGPFGHHDMAGNVWEWCSSLYWLYPYWVDDGREDITSNDLRVMHGGSWRSKPVSIRCAARQGELPTDSFDVVGFRVARDG